MKIHTEISGFINPGPLQKWFKHLVLIPFKANFGGFTKSKCKCFGPTSAEVPPLGYVSRHVDFKRYIYKIISSWSHPSDALFGWKTSRIVHFDLKLRRFT